jgi:hypothetical protein
MPVVTDDVKSARFENDEVLVTGISTHDLEAV